MPTIQKILSGRKGGKIAASHMTPEARKERARAAALARWEAKRNPPKPVDADEIIRKTIENQ